MPPINILDAAHRWWKIVAIAFALGGLVYTVEARLSNHEVLTIQHSTETSKTQTWLLRNICRNTARTELAQQSCNSGDK